MAHIKLSGPRQLKPLSRDPWRVKECLVKDHTSMEAEVKMAEYTALGGARSRC